MPGQQTSGQQTVQTDVRATDRSDKCQGNRPFRQMPGQQTPGQQTVQMNAREAQTSLQ